LFPAILCYIIYSLNCSECF